MSRPAQAPRPTRRRLAPGLLGMALLLGLANTAQALDLWQDIRRKIDDFRRAPTLPAPLEKRVNDATRALTRLSEAEEVALGRQAAGSLLGAAPLVKDARLQRYVNRVGRWIAAQSDRPELAWHFGVIESADINAFAAPGGYVFVTRGLYRMLRNESELAGVLAHEIAHVVEKHHLKALEKERLLEQGRKVLGEQAGTNEKAQSLIGTGAQLFARTLDKDTEHEADRLAMLLAARAGYDPFGLPMVLQDLAAAAPTSDRIKLLFKTHPPPEERLTALEQTGQRLEKIGGKTTTQRFVSLTR